MRKLDHRVLSLAAAWVCLGVTIAFHSDRSMAQSASPPNACEPPPAKATSVQGSVEVRRVGGSQWVAVKLADTFCPGDQIRVLERSRADVTLLDQTALRLNANSTITVEAPKERRTGVIGLLRGATHILTRGPNSLEVNTPYTLAGVRGTEFLVAVGSDSTQISVFEGTVVAENAAGMLALNDGQSAVASAGKAPTSVIVARPRDAVQWSLYYPPVLYFAADEFPAGTDWRGNVRNSLGFYSKGDITRAFDALQGVPNDVSDPRFYAYRAHLLLMVGRVDDARADIDRALKLAPNDANAAGLQTIIDITVGDRDKALAAAQKAVAANPNSATAWIAQSYAQQARFDLEAARRSALRATELAPQNALAWARLAEMQSSFGELNLTLAAAQKAVAADPDLSRTQTVLGFAYLTQVKTAEARNAFDRAIVLDQADPLPRLGLGLAKIREGSLEAGGRDLEVAASLDPNNSIVRSYLGKTYYEEKRSPLDEREFAVAKQLDPNDPTPYFYDAIAKQTTNRPVEALRDMEQAIQRNDNRAVYRSELLLDSDAAARSASLARVYSDLGFQELALVEGWKSVNTDPSNFSAHRFLADSYSVLPRHEIARVSELLQSQLLQPINMTPLQPQLAESNLFLISSQGPATASFLEFNPLFSRNGYTAQFGVTGGSHDLWAGEAIVSGIADKFAYSVGYNHFQTNGFRPNSDQWDNLAAVYVQYDFTPQTSAQFEYRYRNTRQGDLQLNFFADDFLPNLRARAETENYRVGLRHAFSPNSIILGSIAYQSRDTSSHDVPEGLDALNITEPNLHATSAELQWLWHSPTVNFVAGGGHFDISRKQTVELLFPPELDFLNFSDTANLDAKHTNVYLYSQLTPRKDVTFTLGASGDWFRTENTSVTSSRNQFNPKLGVTWNVLPNTTLRAAAFRVLKRTLITNQTLEPTQVAGFNQFYDDLESTDAWTYGAAVDHKFSQTLFGGLEFTRRNLDVPIPFTDPFSGVTEVQRVDWKENVGRAYVFWTPNDWSALSAEYRYERFTRAGDLTFGFSEVTTNRVPLGLRLFHPEGLGFATRVTYNNQNGEFQRRSGACCEPGASTFWIVDAALNYRFPKRYGFFTLGVTNLFDKQFKYQETDFNNPTIQPTRTVFARFTVALP
jgi:tetratricopeptide (TPR) repeat protein